MIKVLVVVDMQNDFVDGALGSEEAQRIVPAVVEKIKAFDGDELFVTYDTHFDNYMQTLEGQKLPIPHCIEDTEGHELYPAVKEALNGKRYTDIIKAGFGSFSMSRSLKDKYPGEEIEVEMIGLCTDVCVVSNAIIMRAGFPNARITVDARCCAGVTPEGHKAALETMRNCQIDIIGE
ncbi:MAG: cysteine hydrolase [Lachnospiraceae bacterium]|nr:cysteine hydrolase [Candidatus Minthocola equi]